LKGALSQRNAERALLFVLAWFGVAPVLISLIDVTRDASALLHGLAWTGACLPFPALPFLVALPSKQEG
jgi:hypothetical protein